MGIIGFNYTKFNCENKKSKAEGGVEVKHNISVKDVEKTSLNIGGNKNEVLKIHFSFDVMYGKNMGKVEVEGEVVYTDTKEIIQETMKTWESEKKLNQTVSEVVFKFIYNKSTVKVLDLADSLGLPSPIPLPKIQFNNTKKE